MMSYKLIQPAVNIGIGIGTADLMANVIVYRLRVKRGTWNGMERGMEHGMERGTDVKCPNKRVNEGGR